jgi:hypothetical membrane protein
MVLSATFLSSWFSWSTNALSELGVGEQAILFNSAVLVGGALNLLFALGLRLYLKDGWWVSAGVGLVMVGSVFLALVGVFTIDYLALHGVAAFGYFVLTPIGILLIGLGTKDQFIRKLSFACAILALFAILVLPVVVLALPFKVGFAIPELAESLTILCWTIPMSILLVRAGISANRNK